MKTFLALAVIVAAAPAFAASDSVAQTAGPDRGNRVCAVFPHPRTSARRICLTSSQWTARLGPDWIQILTGRNYEDDMDALMVRTRANPRLPAGACRVC